jgi:amino acid permease
LLTVTVFTLTIAVGVQDRPADAPLDSIFISDYHLFSRPTFSKAISAISSLVFAYAGTPAFFSIVSEMRDPRQYTKALMVCQSIVTINYITVGVVVYYFCGSYVASPALGSAGPLLKKICYGLALPGLIVTTLLVTHVRPFFDPPWPPHH